MELEVRYDISIITMEVISHMLFSNIDQKTKQLFTQLKALSGIVNQMITNPFFIIPGYRYAFKFVIILKQVVELMS